MARVRRLVELVAPSNLSVILLGETGVGKAVWAQSIHERSPRARGRFVQLNCAAVPEALLESELFGYERGAFTGAERTKPGLLEMADAGTFLLDEVGEMPPATQAKLLRVLESREVLRLGGLAPRRIDVRFVAATHRDLRALIVESRFRSDLFYRLNGISLRIPALRERPSEIAVLAREFAADACRRAGRAPLSLDDGAVRGLQERVWPGNIRELKNVVERSVVLCPGSVLCVDDIVFDDSDEPLPSSQVVPRSRVQSLNEDITGYERERILEALARSGGNQTRAAALLGISRRALAGRIATHGLPRPRARNR